jgi:hypothetical protein
MLFLLAFIAETTLKQHNISNIEPEHLHLLNLKSYNSYEVHFYYILCRVLDKTPC